MLPSSLVNSPAGGTPNVNAHTHPRHTQPAHGPSPPLPAQASNHHPNEHSSRDEEGTQNEEKEGEEWEEWGGLSPSESENDQAPSSTVDLGDTSDDEEIENPPDGDFFTTTIQELQTAVNLWAKERGFAVIRQAGRRKRNGEYTRYNFVCDRYGQPRVSRSVGIRQTATRKCSCKWRATAFRIADGWTLRNDYEAEHRTHNHGPSSHASAHPQHRKMKAAASEIILNTSKHRGIRAREVGALVRDQPPDSVYTRKDIYNNKALIRKQDLGGRTPTGALLSDFDELGIDYVIQWADEAKTTFTGLVFTFSEALDLTQQYWEVMRIDLTYGTNVLGFPLYQVTGLTACNTMYNSTFGLINNEKQDAFEFPL